MPEYLGSTSGPDEDSPLEKFNKYRSENPKEKTARKEMKEDKEISTQKSSYEVYQQEFISYRNSFKETFSKDESNEYYKKLKELRNKRNRALRLQKNG
jgi:hypothetical protein